MSFRRLPLLVATASASAILGAGAALPAAPPPPPLLLTVTVAGGGKVGITPRNLTCPPSCKVKFPRGSAVRLTPRPLANWKFDHWAGACTGSRGCLISLKTAKHVGAVFTELPPPPPTGPGSSATNPVPLGQAGSVPTGWTITVTAATPDATAQVLAANQFNQPPAPGNQFFMISVSATNTGTGSSTLQSGYAMRAVGASLTTYTTYDNACGVLPAPDVQLEDPLTASGGTISGNAACWAVQSADASSLEMFYQASPTAPKIWFAVH